MPTEPTRPVLRWFLVVPCLLVLAAIFTWVARGHAQAHLVETARAATPEPVTTLRPRAANATRSLVLPATLQPFSEAPIHARVNGYLRRWRVNIGQHVAAGELLAEIDSPEVEQGLVRARAALEQARAGRVLAGTTTTRYLDLVKSDSVAQQEVDQNRQNLAAQTAGVASASADVQLLEQQRGFESVRAPFAGVITERLTDIGSLVNSGNGGAGTELFRLSRVDTMRIYASIPEAYSHQIAIDQDVSVELPVLPGQKVTGKVTRTNSAIDLGTRTMLVEIDVPNPDGKLLPGAYGAVRFELSSAVRPLLLPAGSVLFQAAGPQVGVVTAANTVELRHVVIGRDLGNVLEITSGLTTEDTVIATPPDYLVDGMPVSVQGQLDMTPLLKGP